MASPFPLAGLLRLRRLREDTAAGELAAANALLRSAAGRRTRARGALSALNSEVSGADELRNLQAVRASSASMLADLQSLAAMHARRSGEAEQALAAAHALTRSVEKLEDKHRAERAAAALQEEQLALDEIASRAHGGQAPHGALTGSGGLTGSGALTGFGGLTGSAALTAPGGLTNPGQPNRTDEQR